MYRFLRSLHKIVGLIGSLFLITISVTGFLLALKGQFTAIKPATTKGTSVGIADMVHPGVALEAAFAKNLPGLATMKDINRLELHADKNVYKITSKEYFHEVQVDAGTGKVLSVGTRNDQLFENIHDLSFFKPVFRETVLPFIALILFILGTSGVIIYFVPVFRRIKHRKTLATVKR